MLHWLKKIGIVFIGLLLLLLVSVLIIVSAKSKDLPNIRKYEAILKEKIDYAILDNSGKPINLGLTKSQKYVQITAIPAITREAFRYALSQKPQLNESIPASPLKLYGTVIKNIFGKKNDITKPIYSVASRLLGGEDSSVRETILAYKLSKNLDKLNREEFVLNTLSFGSGTTGISEAAFRHFRKKVSDLSPPEQIELASLYLGGDFSSAKGRIIEHVFAKGLINPADKQALFAMPPTSESSSSSVDLFTNILAFVETDIKAKTENLELVDSVYTSLNTELQKFFISSLAANTGKLLAIIPKTGEVIAYYSSSNAEISSELNNQHYLMMLIQMGFAPTDTLDGKMLDSLYIGDKAFTIKRIAELIGQDRFDKYLAKSLGKSPYSDPIFDTANLYANVANGGALVNPSFVNYIYNEAGTAEYTMPITNPDHVLDSLSSFQFITMLDRTPAFVYTTDSQNRSFVAMNAGVVLVGTFDKPYSMKENLLNEISRIMLEVGRYTPNTPFATPPMATVSEDSNKKLQVLKPSQNISVPLDIGRSFGEDSRTPEAPHPIASVAPEIVIETPSMPTVSPVDEAAPTEFDTPYIPPSSSQKIEAIKPSQKADEVFAQKQKSIAEEIKVAAPKPITPQPVTPNIAEPAPLPPPIPSPIVPQAPAAKKPANTLDEVY
jgi:Transglycosylase